MNQSEKRLFLIRSLLNERPSCQKQIIPADSERQKILLRGLMNVRRPQTVGADFLQVQDEYLQAETAAKGVTDIADLTPMGPIISGRVTQEDEDLLASCYRSCLELAAENSLESVAFCCISTGEFHFPNDLAAEIAVRTVKEFLKKQTSVKKVIFNVFKDLDKAIYEQLLRADQETANRSAGL